MTAMIQDSQPFDEAERVLCLDGTCIGLVSADGRCKVCGRPGPAPGPAAALAVEHSRQAAGAAPAGSEVGDVAVENELAHPEEADEFSERRLCEDGACIGVLAEDGRCKVCGRVGAEPLSAKPLALPDGNG